MKIELGRESFGIDLNGSLFIWILQYKLEIDEIEKEGINTKVEVTVTVTPEPTEIPVVEKQCETFDYRSVYQSLATILEEGIDSRKD